ncbi:RNA-directed DNA polymerase, eukaryota, Reverse transcriptase zinc-binding domain protein [Artemisia annua]|uniref:RNA-directed DNA polymerase, eukaryota, Reverse transcriptase zinc-binding domain protein n=1 Tax=Artemisia annua TaxID=35608 RepID=A0A2U1M6S3_ARTAN|nr:RNA-directed DNA polymerase, eukaryota, Reverse transcriptase zinc-binding domain protein [Artemisia annua]
MGRVDADLVLELALGAAAIRSWKLSFKGSYSKTLMFFIVEGIAASTWLLFRMGLVNDTLEYAAAPIFLWCPYSWDIDVIGCLEGDQGMKVQALCGLFTWKIDGSSTMAMFLCPYSWDIDVIGCLEGDQGMKVQALCGLFTWKIDGSSTMAMFLELCMRVFKGWDWTSNGSFCSSGSRIILGWNVDAVDLNVIAMTDQVVHTFIRFKADKKELFCSFVYAHNRYTHRRPLWDNLGLHNQLVPGPYFHSGFKGWDWTSNGSFCSSGSRIVLGWNVDVVDLNVVAMTDQVVHTFIRFKADKKELFCSFVYAHNRYTHRRPLWDNLGLHNQLVRNRPWCVLGDFNSALNLEDKIEGSSVIDIAMREFKECVDANELVDINHSGLQFTWTQKPRGLDGTLRKIDRILANLGFLDSFVGAHAIFQPYRVSDHSPAILQIPTMCKFKPRPFKFSNILVQNSQFKQQVQECWGTSVSGFHMFKVVSKLKALKKPFRRMLFREGNIHKAGTRVLGHIGEWFSYV